MQQIFKAYRSVKTIAPLLMAVASVVSCNNGDTKTTVSTTDSSSSKTVIIDTSTSKMAAPADTMKAIVKDTLPPLDTTVKHRPENIKAKKV